MKTASKSFVMTANEEVDRSAATVRAFSGCFDPGGTGGLKTSVSVTVYSGDSSSSLARIWPMKPPAPVMRTCMACLDVR